MLGEGQEGHTIVPVIGSGGWTAQVGHVKMYVAMHDEESVSMTSGVTCSSEWCSVEKTVVADGEQW